MTKPIPQPPDRPLVGNIFDLSADTQVQDLMKLWREYGEIFFLDITGRRLVVLCSHALVDEVSDEKRFDKRVWAPLKQVRRFAGDGLFTAHTFEPNWQKAHNILLPNFSMVAMKRYHPMMLDIARQMLDKWSRLNPNDDLDVADEMTRLTLDTIGLCGFDYRFNSFYRERPHPFIRAMTRALSISMDRSARPEISNRLQIRKNRIFKRSVDLMNDIVDGIIRERRASGEDLSLRTDLMSAMLTGRDRETGEALDDLNIRYQIITFLIAGHETTSGLLSFATHYLLKHPAVLAKARDEVDRVLGLDLSVDPTYRQVTELRYIRQILNESLRLWPTAPMFSLFPKDGEATLGGEYEIDKRDGLAVLIPALHRDPAVWGKNAEAFDPEHFAPEAERARPVNAFKPFGNGQRACIGRQFAMHEAALALGMMLQRFDLHDTHNYELVVKETLTLKPHDFQIRISPRDLPAPDSQRARGAAAEIERSTSPAPVPATPRAAAHGTPLHIFYGSNMGTAESVANRIGGDAERAGFAVAVEPLDHAAGGLPDKGAVLLISSSYNGNPPDNAVRFCSWLEEEAIEKRAAEGVPFAVFGCGNRDWAATYQQVPTFLDEQMERAGGERLLPRGEGDAADDFDRDFERWANDFWPALLGHFDLEFESVEDEAAVAPLRVEIVQDRHPSPYVAAFGAKPMTVAENRELQDPRSPRSTRHLDLVLPTGVEYQTGDHLGVIARNDEALVRRVLNRFGFDQQTRIRIQASAATRTEFPVDQPIAVEQLLTDYVELQDVATRAQIKTMLQYTECPPDKKALAELCLEGTQHDATPDDDLYRKTVLEPRRSVLDLLEDYHACEMPFGVYLSLLSPLRPRYYSISSSPRVMDRICSITVGVIEGPARSGRGTYRGTCSSYLASKPKGSAVYAFVRRGQSGFEPPQDPRTPMIMIGPGTGIAPFRGFLQDRAAAKDAGEPVGPALLFFGCRRPGEDYLYQEELEAFAEQGVVELTVAFSREREGEKCYVQHRLVEFATRVWELLESGANIYVCGDATAMAPGVRGAFRQVHRDQTGSTDEEARAFFDELVAAGRYHVDVWSST